MSTDDRSPQELAEVIVEQARSRFDR